MAAASRILIAGGYGVFGVLLARELLQATDAEITIAGRDPARVRAACERLDSPARVTGAHVDLARPDTVTAAARTCAAVVCTAGPFQSLPFSLPAAAVAAGAHWLDIADDAGWIRHLIADPELIWRARSAGLVVVPGLSTTPAISGALARACHRLLPSATDAVVCLYLGNRNPKGRAAVASALANGVAQPATLHLLTAGPHRGYEMPSADDAMLCEDLGIAARFYFIPQLPGGGLMLSLASRVGPRLRGTTARVLAMMARPLGHWGSRQGCIQVELREGGRGCVAAVVGDQRLAILPAVLAVQGLLGRTAVSGGVRPPADVLGAHDLLPFLGRRGMHVLPPRLVAASTI